MVGIIHHTSFDTDSVWSVGFSPTDDILVVGLVGGNVTVFDVDGFTEVTTLSSAGSNVFSVAVNDEYIAAGTNENVADVWDRDGFGHEASLGEISEWVRSVDFSPDGQFLALGTVGGFVQVYNTDGWVHEETLTTAATIWSVRFSPDGQWIASGDSEHELNVWEVGSWDAEATLTESDGRIWSVEFDPSSGFVGAASEDYAAHVWEVGSWGVEAEFSLSSEGRNIDFSPDGERFSVGALNGEVSIYEAETWVDIRDISSADNLSSITSSHDGEWFVTGHLPGDGDRLHVWEIVSVPVTGVVELDGVPLENATVIGVNDTDDFVEDTATTGGNGEYELAMTPEDVAHILMEYDGPEGTLNAESKPFVVVEDHE